VWYRDQIGEDVSDDDLFGRDDDDESSDGSGSCYRLYAAERWMKRKGTAGQIVGRALSTLKRLKSMVITDWRACFLLAELYFYAPKGETVALIAPTHRIHRSKHVPMLEIGRTFPHLLLTNAAAYSNLLDQAVAHIYSRSLTYVDR